MKAIFLIIASAILAGCATTSHDAIERRVVYACNYGPNLTVTYAQGMARIEGGDETVTLQQRPSNSGFWFESATHSLKGSGDEITYKDRQMAPKQCHAS
jgi:membrane-bound inhibitor of C-type lysozyme